MGIVGIVRVVVLFGALAVGGCGGPASLPAITMTSGGGFSGTAQTWHVEPDGSWTWTRKDKSTRAGVTPATTTRSGRLTDSQRDDLAGFANDADVYREARLPQPRCDWSDGDDERLEVGSVKFRASWCPEKRPNIDRLRQRIAALTTG